MKRYLIIIFFFLSLAACNPEQTIVTSTTITNNTPTKDITATNTKIPTSTITTLPSSTPTPTETPIPISAQIYPNLEEAKKIGFHKLAGHPPFDVKFFAATDGGSGELFFEWDFDGDGIVDSLEREPELHTFDHSGEYTATLRISDEAGQVFETGQRIVVIGEPDWPDWRYGVHLDYEGGSIA